MRQTVDVAKRIARYGIVLAIAITMVAGSGLSAAGFAGPDFTTLYLDRDGADIPAGNWWGISDYAGGADDATLDIYQGPDITGLNLDRDGADVVTD